MNPAPTVLVVDKDKAIRRLLRRLLEPARYRVWEAEDGSGALRSAAERRLELIIMDIDLPDMSGIEVLLRLKEWSQIPVLILSEWEAEAKAENVDLIVLPTNLPSLWNRLKGLWKSGFSPILSPLAQTIIREATCSVFVATAKNWLNFEKTWSRQANESQPVPETRARLLSEKPIYNKAAV